MDDEGSTLLFKGACPSCGSSDANAHYSDGHTFCFSCGTHVAGEGTSTSSPKGRRMADMIDGEFKPLTKRGITEETCRKFGYKIGRFNDQAVHLAPYYTPDGDLVAQKVRFADKSFTVLGKLKTAGLFGQQVWGSGGRMIVITEGEIDAMTVSQVQNNKWPVVSIENGADGAKRSITKQLDWLLTFETVVLMFDMDDPGRKASAECAQLFPPGKCKIASLALKDPNELLLAGRGSEIIDAIWQAKPYRPDGVVRISDIRERILKPPEQGLPWCLPSLTTLTYGRRLGEIYAVGAGTGIGKTDFFTQQIQHDVDVLGEKVGLLIFEQNPAETVKRLAGKFAGKRFHVPDGSWTQDELVEVIDRLEEDDRVLLYDNFGSIDWDVVKATIRYLAHAEGIKLFYLDHLTALAAGKDDEKTLLERITEEMASLAKELNVIIHFISHLATPEGKPHEEGGRVMIRHFKGSRAIGFWAHSMFGLERDQQHDDPRWRGITTFRILKDRYTGDATGKVIYLGYERETGRLYETEAPAEEDAHGFQDETQEAPPF
jgi:twinkle protein